MEANKSKHQNMVKYAVVCTMLFVLIHGSYGQDFGSINAVDAEKFKGEWEGKFYIDDSDQEGKIRLMISDTAVVQYFWSDKDGNWQPAIPDLMMFTCDRNNAIVYWHNQGGVWSETQVYCLSLINGHELDLVWLRQVNNIKEEEDNDIWHVSGHGKLSKKTVNSK